MRSSRQRSQRNAAPAGHGVAAASALSAEQRLKIFGDEYQALGAAIRQYISLSVQVFTLAVAVASAAAAAAFARNERVVVLVIPLAWGLIFIWSMRLYRDVLAMGAARIVLEEEIRALAGQDLLFWERYVVPQQIHSKAVARMENGSFLAIYLATGSVAGYFASQLYTEHRIPGFVLVLYEAGLAFITVLIMYSTMRTIGIAQRSYRSIRANMPSVAAPQVGTAG